MKKVLFAVFVTVSVLSMNAQIKFGVKAGLNIATLKGDIDDVKSRAGLYAGGYARIPLAPKFTFQPEVLFSMQGAKFEYSETYMGYYAKEKSAFKFNYINIPLNVSI